MANGTPGNDNSSGEQLTQWLKEAGQRAGRSAPGAAAGDDGDETYNSPASLHRYLEELAGRPLRSHAEVLDFLEQVAGGEHRAHHDQRRQRMVREGTLLFMLAVSYLHYYYWEVQVQIATLKSVNTFLPAANLRPVKGVL